MILRRALPVSLLAASAVVLAGCASTTGGEGEAAASAPIVASTNVYASIAQALVGDATEVKAVIADATQDPHAYEASARDRLTVQDAELVILNGGGYDPFMEDLLGEGAAVITAVEYAHDYPGGEEHADDHAEADHADDHAESDAAGEGDAHDDHAHEGDAHDDHAHEGDAHAEDDGHEGHDHIEGFNEHVWYDVHTMIHVVEAIAEEIGHELPDLVEASELEANRDELIAELEGLEARLEVLGETHQGQGVFLTEPIGGYLAAAAGLVDVTPEGFAESVEEGQDVAPATLLAATRVIESGDVAVLLANAQTGGGETDRVIRSAEDAGVPVVELSELLSGDQTYAEWMADNVRQLEDALAR